MPTLNTPTVLILGARGRFGLAATRAFARAGWRVLAQVRPGPKGVAAFAGMSGVQALAQSLESPAALTLAAKGATVVVHALNPPYTNAQWTTVAPALLESSIQVTRQLGATLMLPGNLYNFGATMPTDLTESTPQTASTVKGRSRVAMEERLVSAAARGDLRAVVIRAGDFFGSGTGTWFDQLITPKLARGRMTYFCALDIPTAWAYLPDLAQTFVDVANQQAAKLAAFETFHFSGHNLSGHNWVDAMTDVASEQGWLPTGGQLKVGTFPWPLIRIGGLFNPVWAALPEMRYIWQRPHRLVNRKLVALIGSEPHTPLPLAVQATLVDLALIRQSLPSADCSNRPRHAAA